MKHILPILIVSLHFTAASAQVPNAGFEFWTDLLPDDWITNSCPQCDPPWESYIVRQDSDAYSGNFNADLYGNGVFNPHAYTTLPVFFRPSKLKFFTKVSFAPCVNDSGFFEQDTVSAKLELLHNSAVVDSGFWHYTGASILNYQMAEIILPQNGSLFDSCRIYLKGGKIYGGCGGVAEPTHFKVDEVQLEFASGCSAIIHYSKHADTVSFFHYSDHDSVISISWDFGDGQTDTTFHPEHIYAQEGWYNVCLTVEGLDTSGNYCVATTCDSILITHDCIDTSQICPPPSLCCDAYIYDPVCGCDSVTYDNACQATLWHGVTSYTPGACWTTAREIQRDADVTLIPNPTEGTVELRMDVSVSGKRSVIVQVKNIFGQLLSVHPVCFGSSRFRQEINLENIPVGIYFLEITADGKFITTKKLMKR